MRIKLAVACAATFLCSMASYAADAPMQHEHGSQHVLHAIRLETDMGRSRGEDIASWDLDGWVGGDDAKLWLKSEGDVSNRTVEQAELWAMGSFNVATFWDVQAGLRHDVEPHSHSYAVLGVHGLAPYFLETEAHLFVREDGGVSARIREEYELLLTNRLIVRPRVEANFNATRDSSEALGAGLTDVNAGLQTRYEISRAFAPYVEVKYQQSFGQTADLLRDAHEQTNATSLNVGISWLF